MVKKQDIRFVSPRQWARIEQWTRRKPVFALMGEFSAGKSTLMNFLLRKRALPTQVTATQLPPIWFSWGRQQAYVQRPDGRKEPISLDQLDQVGVSDAQFVRIYLEADILEAVDLIDTPGISDPKIASDVWQRAVGQANGVLWCTHATQAWRETERATWVSLPDRLQQNSLLLVTRADALGQKDRQKVLRRINRETGSLFNRSILFSARDAIIARDKTGDADMWTRSGGGKMIDSFLEITENIMESRNKLLTRYQVNKSGTVAPRPVRVTRSQADDSAEADAPVRLVAPRSKDRPAAAETGSVTAFPVRPSRVTPREGDTPRRSVRPQIGDAPVEESHDHILPEMPETGLRAPAPVATEQSTDIPTTSLALPEFSADSDDLSLPDDEFDLLEAEQAIDGPPTEAERPGDILDAMKDELSPEPEASEPEDDGKSRTETAVSTIAALMGEQPDDGVDEDEPQDLTPTLRRSGAEILTMSGIAAEPRIKREAESKRDTAPDDEIDAAASPPLSAVEMWGAVVASEDLPDNADELMSVFTTFLEEYDRIAKRHRSERSKDTLQAIPNAGERSGAEWHVL